MRGAPRRLGRVLFGLAGAGSALFVHFLPAPANLGTPSQSGSAPAVVTAPRPAERPSLAIPFLAPRRPRPDPAEPVAPTPAVLSIDSARHRSQEGDSAPLLTTSPSRHALRPE